MKNATSMHPPTARWNQLRFNIDGPDLAVADWSPREPSPLVLTKPMEFQYANSNRLALSMRLAKRDIEKIRASADSNASSVPPGGLDGPDSRRGRLEKPSTSTRHQEDAVKGHVNRLCKHKPPVVTSRPTSAPTQQPMYAKSIVKTPVNQVGTSKAEGSRPVVRDSRPVRSLSPPVRDTDQYTPGDRPPLHQPSKRVVQSAQESQIRQLRQELTKHATQMEQMQLEWAAERREAQLRSNKTLSQGPQKLQPVSTGRGRGGGMVVTRTHKLYPSAGSTLGQRSNLGARGGGMSAKCSAQSASQKQRDYQHLQQTRKLVDSTQKLDVCDSAELQNILSTVHSIMSTRRQTRDHPPSARETHQDDLDERGRVLRRLLLAKCGAGDLPGTSRPSDKQKEVSPARKRERSASPSRKLTDFIIDEVARDTAREMMRISGDNDGTYAAMQSDLPQIEEVLYRLDQLQAEQNEIRQRWSTLPLEDDPTQFTTPAPQSLCFTKQPANPSSTASRSLPLRGVTPLSLGSRTTDRLKTERDQFEQAWAKRTRQSKLSSVDLSRVGEWISDDLIEELVDRVVGELDVWGEEVAGRVLRGEMEEDSSVETDMED